MTLTIKIIIFAAFPLGPSYVDISTEPRNYSINFDLAFKRQIFVVLVFFTLNSLFYHENSISTEIVSYSSFLTLVGELNRRAFFFSLIGIRGSQVASLSSTCLLLFDLST